jgi:hypothetical protein
MPPYASSSGFAYRDGSAGLVAGIGQSFPVGTVSNPCESILRRGYPDI